MGVEDCGAAEAEGAEGAGRAAAGAGEQTQRGKWKSHGGPGYGSNRTGRCGRYRNGWRQRGGCRSAGGGCGRFWGGGSCGSKKPLLAQEQDRPENQQRRQAWREVGSRIDPARLVFLDESGVTTERTRRSGRAPCGERVREATPAGQGSTLPVRGARTPKGLLAARTIPSPPDAEVFLAYGDAMLCPQREPGPIVVLDNWGAHKVQGVRERGEAAGAELLSRPPDSPDGHPIEQAWSKSKEPLRKAKARPPEV